MKISVNLVPKCPKGEYGTCEVVNDTTIKIEISEELNSETSQFFVTLLHELLHAWIFIMKANGAKLGIKKEHKWIYSVQSVIFEALKLINKRKIK